MPERRGCCTKKQLNGQAFTILFYLHFSLGFLFSLLITVTLLALVQSYLCIKDSMKERMGFGELLQSDTWMGVVHPERTRKLLLFTPTVGEPGQSKTLSEALLKEEKKKKNPQVRCSCPGVNSARQV